MECIRGLCYIEPRDVQVYHPIDFQMRRVQRHDTTSCMRPIQPQVPLLLKMTELHPESLRIKDCIDRTPLHVAAGSGVSLFVIRILTSKYPHACNIQDEDGRTPLHFACDTNCELVLRGQRKLTKRSTLSRYRVCPPCGLVRRGDVGRCQ